MTTVSDPRLSPTPPLGTPVPPLLGARASRGLLGVALRTAIATIVPVVLGHVLHDPMMSWASLGAYVTALADVVDTYEHKVRMTVLVAVGCALMTVLGAGAAEWPLLAVATLTFVVGFAGAAVRGLGRTIGTAGFFTLIAYVASLGTPSDWSDAWLRGAYALAGGVWASLLVLSRWVRGADGPVFVTVSYPYERLSRLARAVARQREDGTRAEREALREHRVMRDAITVAHDAVVRARPGAINAPLHTVIDDADHLFGMLIAMSEAIAATESHVGWRFANIADAMQRLCSLLSSTIAHRAPASDATVLYNALARVEAAIDETGHALREDTEFVPLLAALSQTTECAVDRVLRLGVIGAQHTTPPAPRVPILRDRSAWITQEQRLPTYLDAADASRSVWRDRMRVVLDRYVTPESPVARHAFRVGIACAIAESVARVTQLGHGQWVTLTVLVVLQPDLGTTFRRGAHRILGTVIGGVIAAALATSLPTVVTTFFVLFPLLVITVLLSPHHYALFSMFVTPTFVLFSETTPGDWRLALTRVVNTCVGGALALIAARALWPDSERTRVGDYLAAVLRATARYVRVVAQRGAPVGTEEWMTHRAATGRANAAAEDSILRWQGERVVSSRRVRNAALLVLGARGIAGVTTWLAIIGENTAHVSAAYLEAAATALEQMGEALREGRVPDTLTLPKGGTSRTAQRLEERLNRMHAAAVRYVRG
jgi:uncharacterized membrane protein YccC